MLTSDNMSCDTRYKSKPNNIGGNVSVITFHLFITNTTKLEINKYKRYAYYCACPVGRMQL